MKLKNSNSSFLSSALFTALLVSYSAQAADFTWDSSTAVGYQNSNGIWGTDSFWTNRTLTGVTLQAWNPADTAWFGGNASSAATPSGPFTITLNGSQSALGIRQISNGAGDFTLTGGTLTLTNAGGIRADRGTFTINSDVATSIGINVATQTATSLIVLGGSNTINGTISLTGIGAVKLTNGSALGGTGVLVSAGVTGGTASLDIDGLAISGRVFRANNGFSASLLSSSTVSDASWAGDVQLGSSTATPPVTVFSGNVAAGATGAGLSLTLSGNISGAGGTGILSTLANSRLILTGAINSSPAGTIVATNSTLTVGNDTTTGSLGTGGVSLTAADSTLAFNRSNALPVPNLITGLGKVTAQNSTGTVTLSAANTYSGGTTVSGGRLTIGIASTATGSTLLTGATGIGNVTLGDGVTLPQSGSLWYAETVTLQGDVTLEGNVRQQVGFKTLDLAGGTRTIFVNPTGGNVKQTITGNTALEGTGRSRWEMLDISDTHPAVTNTGTLTVQNGNLALASNLTGSDYAGFMFQFPSIFAGNAGLIVGPNILLKTGVEGALGTTTDSTLTAKLTVNGIWSLGSSVGSGHTVYSLSGSGKVYASMDSANSTGRIVTLNGTAGSTDFSGELSDGPGTGKLSVVKNGTSTQVLSGVNTYTGDTTVTSGVLAVTGSSIANSNKLVINGGKVDLTGAETVGTLFFGAVQQVAGTYSLSGGVGIIASSNFTGSGTLVVTSGPPSGYTIWASANASGQAANLDFDNDGVSNGVEYFMGETGSTFTANPPIVTTGLVRTVTWPRDPAAVATFKVQLSDTLEAGGWTDIVPPNASIDESNPNQVTYTLPSGAPKKFCRLSVTP